MENYFTSQTLYHALLLGMDTVKAHKNQLNELNFFPVPDNDTGENLFQLMHRISTDMIEKENIKDLMQLVSDAAVKGARGNSGAIFSQFFQGLYQSCPQEASLTVGQLITCFKTGSKAAYQALDHPIQGTIITAMDSFSEALTQNHKQGLVGQTLWEQSYQVLKVSVAATKNSPHTRTGVKKVDAGGLAFQYFVDGFIKGLEGQTYQGDSPQDLPLTDQSAIDQNQHAISDDYQYCTEVLVKRDQLIDKADLDSRLYNIGESIVITENERFRRLHIHTNDPVAVIDLVRQSGQIIEVKTDDMVLQQRLKQPSKSKIGLVIDSIADIPLENLTDFVYMLPLNVIVDQVTYQDKVNAPHHLADYKNVTSSQPNLDQIRAFLEPICRRHEQVLVLSVSSKMSGLFDRYLEFKKAYPDLAIHLVDTKLNSVAEGLIAHLAIQKIQEGYSIEALKSYIDTAIKRTKILVSLKNLDGMIKSGRLNHRIGWVLQKIGFLPLVTIDPQGKGAITRKAFSYKKNYANLLDEIDQVKDQIESYALVHVNDRQKVEDLEQTLTAMLGFPPLYITQISSIVENFSGEGSVAIGYQLKGQD
ncbi:TPA: DegV family protein [Streptococcus suis]